jgi:hypothetical protein
MSVSFPLGEMGSKTDQETDGRPTESLGLGPILSTSVNSQNAASVNIYICYIQGL